MIRRQTAKTYAELFFRGEWPKHSTLIFLLASLCALTNPEVPAKRLQTTILSTEIEDLVFEIAWIFWDLSSTHD